MKRAMVGVVVLAACGGSTIVVPSTKKRADQPELQAMLNGERIHFASAFAFEEPLGRVGVVVSSKTLDCDAVADPQAPDETRFELTLVTKLSPTGKAGWRVEGFEFESLGSSQNVGALLDATVDTRRGKHSRIAIDEADKARRLTDGDEKRVLVLSGALDAVGCGRRDAKSKRKAPSSDGFLEVASHSLPIVDAVLVDGIGLNRPGRRLYLSTARIECTPSKVGDQAPWMTVTSLHADLLLQLVYEDKQDTVAILDGDWIGEAGGTFHGAAPSLRATPNTFTTEPNVEITLDGKATVPSEMFGAFPVAIRGKVTASVCRIDR